MTINFSGVCLTLVIFTAGLFPARLVGQAVPATLPDLRLSTSSKITDIAVQEDGKIILCGEFTSVNDVRRTSLARINRSGSVDLTWNPVLPWVGNVFAAAPGGSYIYFAHSSGSQVRVGRLSMSDGSRDENWGTSVGGSIDAIAVNGDAIYIGGSFRSGGGVPLNNLAKLMALGSGTGVQSWRPEPNERVDQIVVVDDHLFVAGDFTHIGGTNRNHLAKLSASTGAADPVWDAKLIRDGRNLETCLCMGLANLGTNLFVAGRFTNAGGVSRQGLAKLSALGSGAVDTNWHPTPFAFSTPILGVVAATNNAIFVATEGFGPRRMGSAVVKLDPYGAGAMDTNWSVSFDGIATVQQLLATPDGLFAAGDFHVCNEAVSLSLAKLDVVTGVRDDRYAAQVQKEGTVDAMARQPDGKVIVAGDFWSAFGLPRRNVARFKRDGSLDTAWAPAIDGRVLAIALNGTNVFVGGSFAKAGGLNRTNLAKLSIESDVPDAAWDAKIEYRGQVTLGEIRALAATDTDLFVAGAFNTVASQSMFGLAKLSVVSGNVDLGWRPIVLNQFGQFVNSGELQSLALSGTNLFLGGHFNLVNGVRRTNLAKVFTTNPGTVDTHWKADLDDSPLSYYSKLLPVGTNLIIGGSFTTLNGQPHRGLAKVSALTGVAATNWPSFPAPFVSALALDETGTNLYVGGFLRTPGNDVSSLAKVGIDDNGAVDTSMDLLQGSPNAILPVGYGIYVAGYYRADPIGIERRSGVALIAVAKAPLLIQDSVTDLLIARNPANEAEVTHFLIAGLSGGTLFLHDGITPVRIGELITVAQGAAGLKFSAGGTITAFAAVNDTPAGAGMASSTLTMTTTPAVVFAFGSDRYRVREGAGSVAVIVRKFGSGAASVNFATSGSSANAGTDYLDKSGALNFTAGDRLKTIIIPIGDDFVPENDETFSISLSNLTDGASLAHPATSTITILDNDVAGGTDSFTSAVLPTPLQPPPSSGVLVVHLEPASAAGQWRVLGEMNWHDSGQAVRGLITGNYRIEFKPVKDFREPPTVTVPVSTGITNPITLFYVGTTNQYVGDLSVIIQPEEVANAADLLQRGQWRRQGETNWHNTGEALLNLNAGSYGVEFKSVPGRTTPANRIVEVGPNATYAVVGTYLFLPSTSAETPVALDFGAATTNEPYLYNGQIQTSIGFGSGFVVKEKVVLTAAHLLFDEALLSYTRSARWFFQRYRDQYEPPAQTPRGWYVFEGYAAQRAYDNTPGVSTPESQNLDAAAIYFLEPAGRGGYGGYLSGEAGNNDFLLSANSKLLAGYPLDGVTETHQGKLHATAPRNSTFRQLYQSVYTTSDLQSYAGNSGGPLYVQADINKYYPAGIYLGGSGQTLVRAIDGEVVDLIHRAEVSSNGGRNNTAGGVALWVPGVTAPEFVSGLFRVDFAPASVVGRAGWRVQGADDTNWIVPNTNLYFPLIPGAFNVECKPVPGFVTPPLRRVDVIVDQTTMVKASYGAFGLHAPRRLTDGSFQATLTGETGRVYDVQWSGALAPWSSNHLVTLTNSTGHANLMDRQATNSTRRFYRAVER